MMELEQTQLWPNDAAALLYPGAAAEPISGTHNPSPPLQRARSFRLRPDYTAIASDVLVFWDLSMVLATAAGCAAISGLLTAGPSFGMHAFPAQEPLPLIGALLAPLVLHEGRLHQGRPDPESWGARAGVTVLRVMLLFGLLVVIGALTGGLEGFSAKWFLLWLASTAAAVLAGRALLAAHIGTLKRRRVLREHVAIIGTGPLAERLLATLRSRPTVEIVGVFDDRAPARPAVGSPLASSPTGGTVRDLIELGKRWPLDRVFVALPQAAESALLEPGPVDSGLGESASAESGLGELVTRLMALDAEIVACPQPTGFRVPGQAGRESGGLHLVRLVRRPIRGWGLVLKAVEDKVLGGLLFLLVLPAMALIAVAVRLESPGPAIFRQRRHGWNNAEFEVFKFRTMTWRGDELASGARQTMPDDPRVTRVGWVLRKTSLDELPQLLNVLRGDMSLVGPRPHPVAMRTEGQLGSEILAEYGHRHRVKPGITGWAQVNGSRGPTELPEQVRRRVAYDIAYIETWSLLLDIKILALTPWRMLVHRGSAF